MKVVTLLDTATSSDNLGDEIIMDAVRDWLYKSLNQTYFYTVATHVGLSRKSRQILSKAEMSIVGGTNFVSSNLLRNSGWKISALDLPWIHNVVLMGVGWRDYQKLPSFYTSFIYKRVFSRRFIHSCRDKYSAERLRALGFRALNTSCPTMWGLTPDICSSIPVAKSPTAIVALTYYRPNMEFDKQFLSIIRSRYERVLFWTQQAQDLDYLRSLGDFEFEIISPNVIAYNKVLDTVDADYVGSRLHGGIRALQKGRRALILSVDNRAREIGIDTGLPVIDRSNIPGISAWIDKKAETKIALPTRSIMEFANQFTNY